MSDDPANAPNIGKLDMEKEARWQRERAECWARFQRAVDYLRSLNQTMRGVELDRYQRQHGIHARQTLEGYLSAKFPLPS